METLYEDFREHPELHINKDFEKVLENTLSNEVDRTYLHNAIEVLLYQMRSQKQGTAAFELDCIKLLQDLNISFILVTEDVLKFVKFINFKPLQLAKVDSKRVIKELSK